MTEDDLRREAAALAASVRARVELEMGCGIEEAVVKGGMRPGDRAKRNAGSPEKPGPVRPLAPGPAPALPPRVPAPGAPPAPPRPPSRAATIESPAASGGESGDRPLAAAGARPPASSPKAARLADMARALAPCVKCALAKGRTQVVFGVGNPDARLMFVGEGPGADEDRLGEPFVGRAGQLLDKIIAAMGLRREDVYIANVVKCRPPENRVPMFDEVEACLPFLREQIEIVKPELIVALGATAARALLGTTSSMSALRGRTFQLAGIPLIATYHPAYLLRNPSEKAKVWEDMKVAMKMLGLAIPAR